MKPKTLIGFLLGPALLLSLAAFHAPSFLLVSEDPVKSDAVVLFLGGQKGIREKEAYMLVKEGYADYLIIPAYGQIRKRGPDGKLERLDPTSTHNTTNVKLHTAVWMEDTHIEVLETKRLMDASGLRSALFVSSPYHLRRIKMISGELFGDSLAVRYVPTRYEAPSETFWLFDNRDRRLVLTEYAKISWFLLYRPFV